MTPIPLSYFEERTPAMLALLGELVQHESPTTDKASVDALGADLARRMERLGARVTRFEQTRVGDHWLGEWGQGAGGILLLAHMDTVHPLGTLEKMPWHVDDETALGPGALDMKAGIVLALTAIQALRDANLAMDRRVGLLLTSDEETGSQTSRALIEDQARGRELVLCLEPGLADGSLKTWRKGILTFDVEAHGASAHAGASPNDGVNAIQAIVDLIPAINGLANTERGTTVNVGVIEGGTRSNVVPAYCRLEVDVRARIRSEGDRVQATLLSLATGESPAEIRVSGGWNRPPMERSPAIQSTYGRAAELARSLGFSVGEGGTGGGSDANFVAPLGVPVLDGLGAVGRGAHSPEEQIRINSLAPRAALISALISESL